MNMVGGSQKFRSLICSNVPEEFNNEMDLARHFSQFGVVRAVVPAPLAGKAKVVFDMAHEAELARQNGEEIDPRLPSMVLLFADDNRVTRSRKTSESNSTVPKTLQTTSI